MKKLLMLSVLLFAVHAFAYNPSCRAYFTVVEHDDETSGLNMVGLDDIQRDWFKKHGSKQAPGLCLVNGDASGRRINADNGNEQYIAGIVGNGTLYSVVWGQSRIFIPDTKGGHYAWLAKGIVYIWSQSADNGKGDFVALTPIQNTNRTILSSASLSLLKAGLKEILARVNSN